MAVSSRPSIGLTYRAAMHRLIAAQVVLVLLGSAGAAETMLRVATFNTELSRKGPGLLLRDILRGDDPQVQAAADVIATAAPDILVLQDVDFDHGLATLTALRDVVAEAGMTYPHLFALQPNTGRPTGLDLDGDGRLGEPEDAHSYGWFAGEGGMAILSRFPIDAEQVQDFSASLWADMPDPLWPPDPMPGQENQRLSRAGHWMVPVDLGDQRFSILAFHASPPVFDGPEDRNGRRNHDEILFWQLYLDDFFGPAPDQSFAIVGDANLDPSDGEGRKGAIRNLLSDPRLQDPEPRRDGDAVETADHTGDPALDTVAWPEPEPGHLRVSYVLPSADLVVRGAGVYWPSDGVAAQQVTQASRHRLVWVDLMIAQ